MRNKQLTLIGAGLAFALAGWTGVQAETIGIPELSEESRN